MSRRSVVVLSVLVIVCLAVIAASALASVRLFESVGHPRGGDVADGPFGEVLTRLGLDGWAQRSPAVEMARAAASYTFLYLTSVLTLFVAPRRLRAMQATLERGSREGLRLLGIGALAVLAVVFIATAGLVAFVAFPLPVLLLIGLLVAGWLGMVSLSLAWGRAIGRWAGLSQPAPLFSLALGQLVVSAIAALPLAGLVFVLVIAMQSVGVAVATRLGHGGAWSLNEYYLTPESVS